MFKLYIFKKSSISKLNFKFKNASVKSDYIIADVIIMRKPDEE